MSKRTTGKSKLNYYDAFRNQARFAHQETRLLVEIVEHFSSETDLARFIPRAHEIENKADDVHHQVMSAIDVDFVTPFDREDIIDLSDALDDITDEIEEVIQHFYMYNITEMHRDVLPMAELLEKAARTLLKALDDFESTKKFDQFIKRLDKVNEVEEEVDNTYMEVVRHLFTTGADHPMLVIAWKDIFGLIEESADLIYKASAIMGDIILKNS